MACRQGLCWRQRRVQRMCLAAIALPLGVALITCIIVFLRTVALYHPAISIIDAFKNHPIDLIEASQNDEVVSRLAGALQVPTISYGPEHQEKAALLQMHTYLADSFPLIHSTSFIRREIVNHYSLLYTIEGKTKGKVPYLLASHFDVVPVDSKAWNVPPFEGQVVNSTYVYGRGAIDDKAGVMGMLEAVEYMLYHHQRPQRTFYIALGHDEEISGKGGAQELAKALKARGVNQLDFVLDEGFPISHHLIPGTDNLIAIVGVSEKGSATVELSVSGSPGHSSFPQADSTIGILSAALVRLRQQPQPSQFGSGPEREMFTHLAPHVSLGYRLLYGNLWLFAGIMSSRMERQPLGNAMVRTTTAITMLRGGIKENVMAPSASAIINHRVHPSQTIAQVLAYDRQVIDDPRVVMTVKRGKEAHPISPSTAPQYHLLAASIKQVFPGAIVVPGVFIANTDTRWYLDFTPHIYRFLPVVITASDIPRYHGTNERISVQHYYQTINFFYRLIRNADLLIDSVPFNQDPPIPQEL